MLDGKKALAVPEAIEYQKERYGCVAFGRDALYALARSGRVRVIRNGTRKLLFPASTIDALMQGNSEEVA